MPREVAKVSPPPSHRLPAARSWLLCRIQFFAAHKDNHGEMAAGAKRLKLAAQREHDASGRLDKAAFVVGLEAALGDNQTPRSRAALAALFDVVRSRTAIHAATRVPPDCVRARA